MFKNEENFKFTNIIDFYSKFFTINFGKNIKRNEDFFVLVRVDESLNGKLYFGGNIFAFSKDTYYRTYFGEWKKFSTGEPSINVDVQIEK